MDQKVLVFEPRKCIGCKICETWCSITHYNVNNPAKTCIKIVRDHERLMDQGIICHQCIDAPCINSCKFDALSRDNKTCAVIVDEEKCTGCRKCIHACPYGAPSMYPGKKLILICDLCNGSPQCVQYCPEQAIQYVERHKAERLYRTEIVKDAGRGKELS
ncbi:MAG: 4Fe-4S dicluster domain-containing protein [Desulfobacula sp.]|uniref:4Fe-4S dicluster domain-containing protein n=1 Tax=Desulfobacula sp. TaxID=2593537 RepID=UPI0025BB69D9|nr:4Fe-4S dicluster domain-containing protein [Desulfobacula sp.]MCD4719181.1 4Fe-4S dicluster domain-containing protein [Desulfobacula sp.]